jgi:hypothetical protein
VGTTEFLEAADSLVENIKRRAIADAHPHVMTEGHTGNYRHFITGEELVAKIH